MIEAVYSNKDPKELKTIILRLSSDIHKLVEEEKKKL